MQTYGVWNFSVTTIVIVSLAAIITLMLAAWLYYSGMAFIGFGIHLISLVLLEVLLLTGWTSVNWMSFNGGILALTAIGSIALLVVWVLVTRFTSPS